MRAEIFAGVVVFCVPQRLCGRADGVNAHYTDRHMIETEQRVSSLSQRHGPGRLCFMGLLGPVPVSSGTDTAGGSMGGTWGGG